MKRFIPFVFAFFIGVATASIAWRWYVIRVQFNELAAIAVVNTEIHASQAEMGEIILKYLDNPDQARSRQLAFAASNSIRSYLRSPSTWDTLYPRLGVGRKLAEAHEPNIRHFEQFMREREERNKKAGEPIGATNEPLLIRSATNLAPSAAGSGR